MIRTLHPRDLRGFTLIEMILSMAIMTMLFSAIGAAVILTSRSLESGRGAQDREGKSTELLERITSDIQLATAFTERTDKAVTFTVPDRNGDGAVDQIRYAWSGTSGDALTIQYNGGASAPLATGVHALSFNYLTEDRGLPPPVEGAEQLLLSHDDVAGGSFLSYSPNTSRYAGQYIMPSLPNNAIAWRVTRVRVRLKRAMVGSSNISVKICGADATSLPNTLVLATAVVPTSSLATSYAWIDVNYGGMVPLAAGDGAAIVIHTDIVGDSCDVEYEQNVSGLPTFTHWTTSASSGASWTAASNNTDMRFYVYGKVTTQGS